MSEVPLAVFLPALIMEAMMSTNFSLADEGGSGDKSHVGITGVTLHSQVH